jgi:DNA-binding MarR family transcriptional regulator
LVRPRKSAAADPTALRLENFVPFRLNRLASAVSEHLSEIYRTRFGLEIPEWRVLVTVGQRNDCTAQFVAASARMHKTRVSRAVAALTKKKLIERAASADDARERHLQLTPSGRRLYAALVPFALERERSLLACLDEPQRRGLIAGLTRLERFFKLTGV